MKKGFLSKNFMFTMILATLVVAFGIFITFQSQSFLSILLILFGIASVINGVKELLLVAQFNEFKTTRIAGVISGIVSIVVGLVIIIYPFVSTQIATTIVLYLFAFQLIIAALSRLVSSLTAKRNKLEGFSLSIIPAVFNIVVALIFIIYPGQVTDFFVKIVGIITMFYGLGLFVWAFRMRKVEKDFSSKETEGETEELN